MLGVLLGVATLCRAVAMCLPVGIGAALLATRHLSCQAIRWTLVLLVSFGLVVSLWLAYNYARFDGRIMFLSKVGQDLANTLLDEADSADESAVASRPMISTGGIVVAILTHPAEYARIGVGNVVELYRLRQAHWRWLQAIELGLGLLGMAVLLPAGRKSLALYLVIGVITFFHFLTHGIFRYALPLAPYWFLFAAAGILWFPSHRCQRGRRADR